MRIRAVIAALAVALVGCGEDDDGRAAHLNGDGGIDAPADALVCMDPYEAQDPFTVPTQPSTILPGAMICPAGDQDKFAVTIQAGGNLEVVVDSDVNDPVVEFSILNNQHTPLYNAVPAGPHARRGYVPNLPAGNYYVMALAGPAAVSHYQVTINLTGP